MRRGQVDRQHGAGGFPQHFFRHAPVQQAGQTSPAVGSHHDQITRNFSGEPQYLVCRLSRVAGRVRAFRLVHSEEGLILQGHAFTHYAKQLAQHAVMAPTTLPIAANEIEVS
jgi:hypothetical protein